MSSGNHISLFQWRGQSQSGSLASTKLAASGHGHRSLATHETDRHVTWRQESFWPSSSSPLPFHRFPSSPPCPYAARADTFLSLSITSSLLASRRHRHWWRHPEPSHIRECAARLPIVMRRGLRWSWVRVKKTDGMEAVLAWTLREHRINPRASQCPQEQRRTINVPNFLLAIFPTPPKCHRSRDSDQTVHVPNSQPGRGRGVGEGGGVPFLFLYQSTRRFGRRHCSANNFSAMCCGVLAPLNCWFVCETRRAPFRQRSALTLYDCV